MTFFEKREESCHQKRDMPLGSFSLNIFIFCCKHINKYTGSNRSARMVSIFQGIQNCKKNLKRTIIKQVIIPLSKKKKKKKKKNQRKSLCNLFGRKMESTLPNYAPSILPLLIIPCIGHSKSHFLTLVLNGKKMLIC